MHDAVPKSIYDILDSAPEDLTDAERNYLIDKFYPYSPLIDYMVG